MLKRNGAVYKDLNLECMSRCAINRHVTWRSITWDGVRTACVIIMLLVIQSILQSLSHDTPGPRPCLFSIFFC